ncbi:MAG TPA: hypothetical protein VN730_04540 [Steroidobacteraceae bacterium]|nr:hypothetical protein [Steroidobacteraceae bacterium]
MRPQDLTSIITAVFIIGMVWLRTRMHYARLGRGTPRLAGAGRWYFAAVLGVLAAGWFVAPPIGRSIWPAAGGDSTILRVIWFLATYYLFILVHRALQARRIEVFGVAEPVD